MRMPKVKKFIQCVKATKCLYDSNVLEFKNLSARKKAWQRLSIKMKTEVPILKKQWIALREEYFIEMKRCQRRKGAGLAEDCTWPYYKEMDFMKPFLKSERSSTNNPDPQDEQLIDLIKIRRYMYDKSTKEYRMIKVKKCAWKEIADIVNQSVYSVRVRWKSLRDRYVKETRILEDSSSEGQEHQKSSWVLYPKLDFLRDFVEPRSRSRNLTRPPRPPQQTVKVEEVMEIDSTQPVKTDGTEQTERCESDEWEESSFISMSGSSLPDLITKVEAEDPIIAAPDCEVAQLPDLPDSQNSQNETPQPPQPSQPPQSDLTGKYVSIIDDKLRLLPEREREQIAMEIINMLNNRIYQS